MKLTSIQAKTLLFIMPLLLLVMLSLSGISYYYSRQTIEAELQKEMSLQMSATLENFNTKLTSHKAIPETLARVTENIGDALPKTHYARLLEKNLDLNNKLTFGIGIWFEPGRYKSDIKYFGPYVYKDNGKIVYTEDYEKPEYDYPNQDWYKIGTNTSKKVVWSAPFYDDATKVTMLTAAAPFYDDAKKFRGVVSADLDISDLQKTIADIKVGQKGWAFLLSGDGTYLADLNKENIMKVKLSESSNPSLAATAKLLLEGKETKTSFSENNARYLLYSAPLQETGWVLALVMPESEVYAPLNALLMRQVAVAVVAIIIVAFGIILYARFITRNINEIKDLSTSMADGDLSRQLTVHSADEFGQMGENFNLMLRNLKSLLLKIMDNSQQVAASSEELTASAQQTAKATEHISHTIQDISSSFATQAHAAVTTTKSVNSISDEISHLSNNMRSVTDMTTQTAVKAVDGNKVVRHAIGQMTLINEKVGSAAAVVDILGEKSREIDQIISLITSIAGQTNLLALNAAIEAARAGEQGRGFAVVADEVRKLAEQSETAAKQISAIINEIQKETGRAVQIMGDSSTSVQEGISLVNQAESTFLEIQTAIQAVSSESQDIAKAITNIASGANNIVASVQKISDSVNQTSTSIQSVAASTEEQTATMQEIQAASSVLAHLACELDESINKFKL